MDENDKKKQGKGFAGLNELVSDVDTTFPHAAERVTAGSPETASEARRPDSQPTSPKSQSAQQEPYTPAKQSGGGSSSGKWMIGVSTVIGVLALIGLLYKTAPAPAPTYAPPAQTATPSYSPPSELQQVPSRPTESTPPIGQDLVLSTEQIQYCQAENIRMDGAKSALNNYSSDDVDRFNAMVADYNSRCGSFRYRNGALESARRDIEPYRNQLRAEGMMRFAPAPTTTGVARGIQPDANASVNAASATPESIGTTYPTSFDCTKARSIPEYLICHDPELAAADVELAGIYQQAKTAAYDKQAFADRTRKQWNYREKHCSDKQCVAAWYAYQKDILTKISQTGDVTSK
ncbi:Uncharacterized protein conserved in bacteria, putative lipoprotein [Pandoraea pnomenusa]|uniref:Uncharacterized protein conserved in bacteria, putative lipoprotein n=1 Tax=Pandoraea pnomenusa TaxID=93220 RepID=A0A378YXV9_9BURK|nr:Uncharacterized protein conserved in bacteria, putative lipoprotein [Pandoraea pnomenusa]